MRSFLAILLVMSLLQAAQSSKPVPKPVHLTFFFTPLCRRCIEAEKTLAALQRQFPNLKVKRFNSSTERGRLLYEAFTIMFKVPEEKHLNVPAFFVGEKYFIYEIHQEEVAKAVKEYSLTGAQSKLQEAENYLERAEKNIIESFESLGRWAIVGAGLADGINPCAFATIIFMVVYLTAIGRNKNEVLVAGAFFAIAIFLTYFLIGVGFLSFLRLLKFLGWIKEAVLAAAAGLCLLFGVISLRDFFAGRKGAPQEVLLRLPKRLKSKIQVTVTKKSRSGNIALGALSLGFLVSLLEAVCTGQVYLPTIIFVTKVAGPLRRDAYKLLLMYNLAFIVPLLIVFGLIYAGVGSQRLADFTQRHILKAKIALAAVFFFLGSALLYFLFQT